MSRAWVTRSPVAAVGGLRPADTAVTYKAVQPNYNDSARRGDGTAFEAAQVGAIRIIPDDGVTSYNAADISPLLALYDAVEAWLVDVRAHGIFPIVCLPHQSNVTLPNWTAIVTQWATRINAGAYELGNEMGATYSGGTGWSNWFDDAAAAAAAIKAIPVASGDPPRKVLLGAPRDTDGNTYFTNARTKWTSNAATWQAAGFDGVAIHPYGQGGNAFSQSGAIASMNAKLTAARTNRVPLAMPLWVTECGWGVGGNSNSTLVAGQNNAQSTSSGSQTIPASGTFVFNVANANDTTSGKIAFTTTGKLWIQTVGGANDGVISYAGKTGNQFTGCLYVSGATGTVANGTLVSQELDPNATRQTAQNSLLVSMYDSLWRRRFTTDAQVTAAGGITPAVNCKCLTWFWWRPSTTLRQWWHYCGLMATDGTHNPSYTPFAADTSTRPLT